MYKTKVLTVVGTRPEVIRLSRVIAKLDENVSHILVHTGQNYDYELNEIFFKDLKIRKPDYFLNSAGVSAAQTIGNVISLIDPVLEKENPDAFLVLGDTNSCLAAISAKRRKIPIFHMEAGNRCFDFRVPEEINRRMVDHISDINLPYSDLARQYLIAEGFPADRIIKSGSPMFEVLTYYAAEIEKSGILTVLNLEEHEYFLVSAHREENIDSNDNFDHFIDTLNAICEKFCKRIILSTHPRTKKRIVERGVKLHPLILAMKPLGFFDYVRLQKSAIAVLSDSGTITEESSILNFPALNIRESHERPEGMDEASVILAGLKPNRVLEALDLTIKQRRGNNRSFRLVSDYAMPNVSDKILRIILSYIEYVRRTVWHLR